MQGDIVAITNASGAKVVEYVYDSWGKLISTTGSLASTVGVKNPYRYRSYRYDTETGLYYLNSRYYDPEVKRFINPDSAVSGIGGSPLGYNLFAYCFNNPVNMSDSSGNWPQWIKDAKTWVENNIFQPIGNFFSPKTNTVSGQFNDGIFQGSGSASLGYSDAMVRSQVKEQYYPKHKDSSAMIGGFGKASVVNVSGKIGIGNKHASLSTKGVADILTASAQAGLYYKDNLGLKLGAKAAVASGRATIELNVYGYQIELGVYGDFLSIGAEVTIGIFEGGFDSKIGASAIFGGGLIFRVKKST